MARDDCWDDGIETPTLNRFLDLQLSATDQYLHVAVNLFIASSGTYDPLTTDYSDITPTHISDKYDILSLQKALGGPLTNSAEHLRRLFEIEGGVEDHH